MNFLVVLLSTGHEPGCTERVPAFERTPVVVGSPFAGGRWRRHWCCHDCGRDGHDLEQGGPFWRLY